MMATAVKIDPASIVSPREARGVVSDRELAASQEVFYISMVTVTEQPGNKIVSRLGECTIIDAETGQTWRFRSGRATMVQLFDEIVAAGHAGDIVGPYRCRGTDKSFVFEAV